MAEPFKIPAEFDFKKYLFSTFGLYKGKSTKEVTIRFTPEKSKWIKDQIWHKDQKVNHLKDGSLELKFPVSDFSEIKLKNLGFKLKLVFKRNRLWVVNEKMHQEKFFILKSQVVISKQLVFLLKVTNCDLIA